MKLSNTQDYKGAKIDVFTTRLHSGSVSYIVNVDERQVDVSIDGTRESDAVDQAVAAAKKFVDSK